MAKEAQDKVVEDHVYNITQWSGSKAFKMLIRLSKMCGESVVSLATSNKTSDGQIKEGLVAAVRALVTNLDENATLELVQKDLLANVLCDHKPIPSFDLHFQGRIGHLFKVLYAVLEVQYTDFFGALAQLKDASIPMNPPA